jgi:hypothetical protein
MLKANSDALDPSPGPREPGGGRGREQAALRAEDVRAAQVDALFERVLELDIDLRYPFVGRC